jgi:hypothetical protein
MPTTTHTLLYSNVLASNATTVTISGFASTYRDLILVISGTSTGNFYPRLQFNGDTAANYSWQSIEGAGTTPSANSGLNETGAQLTNGAFAASATTDRAHWNVNLMNYSNTSTTKLLFSRAIKAGSGTSGTTELVTARWNSSSAITSILLYSSNGANLATGSTIYMYGVD